MTSLILTTKTARYGKSTIPNLPTSDVSTVVAVSGTYYEVVLGGTLSPDNLQVGDYVSIQMYVQGNSASPKFWQIRKADGVTVLATAPSTTTVNTWEILQTYPVKVTSLADWVGIKVFTTVAGSTGTNKTQMNTIETFYADSINQSDESTLKIYCSHIFFLSTQSTFESVGGQISNRTAKQWGDYSPNSILNGIIWSANSGYTLYSWSGSQIGISA